jgi:predicted O-methyltransferase YrrM
MKTIQIKDRYKAHFANFEKQKNDNNRLWNIDDQSAAFLYEQIIIRRPKHILEIGTSNGYSTFWLSLAADRSGASVESIEIEESRYRLAIDNLSKRNNVKLYLGNALEIIPKLQRNYEFVFIDAGKIDYNNYLRLLLPKLVDNCVIIADNIRSHQASLEEYLNQLSHNPSFISMSLDIGSGLELSVYNKSEEIAK